MAVHCSSAMLGATLESIDAKLAKVQKVQADLTSSWRLSAYPTMFNTATASACATFYSSDNVLLLVMF